jgi:hypothetical protein
MMIKVIVVLVQNEIEVYAIAGTKSRFHCSIFPYQPPKQIISTTKADLEEEKRYSLGKVVLRG